jgi:GDP-4-dehydro-6-deoxy-D-mannose reductase
VKVLVTGASGFVGPWLLRELVSAGHEAVGTPPSSELDITDPLAVAALVDAVRPDAIAHLAGLSFGPDARREPERAFSVNVGGTRAVLSAAAALRRPAGALVVSSADVYGSPANEHLPLTEAAPLLAEQPYGLSKVAQERAALESVTAGGPPLVIVRPFNHAGPGQRPEFVVPALARRILAARSRGDRTIAAGNIDVRRDFSDVRDVVRAYRLILEDLGHVEASNRPRIYNIATGKSVPIRSIVAGFAALAGIAVDVRVDPALVRESDPPDIRGDASLITTELGWHPTIPFEKTLEDVFEDALSGGGGATG